MQKLPMRKYFIYYCQNNQAETNKTFKCEEHSFNIQYTILDKIFGRLVHLLAQFPFTTTETNQTKLSPLNDSKSCLTSCRMTSFELGS